MARGRKTGGRQKGTKNKLPFARQQAVLEALSAGETPVAYMLRIMRDPKASTERRDTMAISVANYVHPKVQAPVKVGGAVLIDKRIEIHVIDHRPAED